MNITPKDIRIRALFQSTFFKIPRFQRPYSWDRGNIEEFWNDAIGSTRPDYFIGSMVMFGDKASQDLNVVDGQQRLTTITIFLAALRDTFLDVGEKDLAEGVQNVIQRTDVITNQRRYVLLTETSYPYFQEYVQKLGAPDVELKPDDEEKGIQSAYRFAREKFNLMKDAAGGELPEGAKRKTAVRKRLESARDRLLGLDVIVIQLDNEDDAYVVFETLNTRGKDLEPKDLIKNLLAKLLPAKSSDVDATKIKWNGIVKSLAQSAASIDPSTYIHHWWLSRYDYTPERTLFQRFKAQITKANAAETLTQLSQDVEQYRRIFEPDNFSWSREEEPLKRSLRALAIFRVRQPTPMILALLRAYRDKNISLKQVRETMQAIERFHFMHTAVSGLSSSGGVSMMYAAAARELTAENDAQKRAGLLQDFRAKMKARQPDRNVFLQGFKEIRFSNADTRNRPLVRYVLERADAKLRADATINYGAMTIEHIGAQNPQDDPPLVNYSEIGNLVLVSESLNGELKNKPFREKKAIMKNAKLPMDSVLDAATTWDAADVTKRTEALAATVYES
ncbi:DUF262 domain-containing HNH endonuclease family protein [uncultured Sphingomonas sp.]|uniref:DUF262 domain-containing protein n=1 Tax=uncultured Sphingomonas sp. TaxID=158754 RepID=UPI0025E14E85|nr:DUF262 domain-containing HNH endonuclease family protein [uncultured Sphingomonas sp.]